MSSFIDDYDYSALPEDCKIIADLIGIEATKELMKAFRGCTIYFPSKPSRNHMQRYIKENYDGENRKKIQRRLQISTDCFYRVLRSKLKSVF